MFSLSLPAVETVVMLLIVAGGASSGLDDRPRIRASGGHLLLEAAPGRNISLATRGPGGSVAVNGLDVAKTFDLLVRVQPQLEWLKDTSLSFLIQNLTRVSQEVSSQSHLAATLDTLRGDVSNHQNTLGLLQTRVQGLDNILTPLNTRVGEISSVLGPDGAAKLQNISNFINTMSTQMSSSSGVSPDAVYRLQQRVVSVESRITELGNFESRVEALELSSRGGARSENSSDATSGRWSRGNFRALRDLRSRVRSIEQTLVRQECNSQPCQRSGTCIDGYGTFQCLCPPGWSGPTCGDDVDECSEYQGTDLGCQNGATCQNTPGGFRCSCAPGFYGRHCTLRQDSCSDPGSGAALCDHGDCLPQASSGHSYTCRCHQGWTKAPGSPSCSQDVDECQDGRTNHCSSNPPTQCINIPGSYVCGACPAGYTGDGFRCTDVNECEIFNGGCSFNPRVQCINEIGGRRCGSCPSGYTGDGLSCLPRPSPCLSGPCYHLARCIDNLQHMLPNYYQCQCPPEYAGNGIGPFGCAPSSGGGTGGGGGQANPCQTNPCIHGTCVPNGFSFVCHCQPGYAGSRCELQTDPCLSTPCQNGGTCSSVPGTSQFTCSCPQAYTGTTCTERTSRCGGVLTGTGGVVHYPSPGVENYDHNISCAWRIDVPTPNIINVTFSEFHLESGPSCPYDWLQIHDGIRSTAPLIGRFCGANTPGVNNTLLSNHNQLYLWFRSDHSRAESGFTFNWTAQAPECGGDLRNQEHGSITSPGYPGNYPSNRNCTWTIRTTPGKRILFHFASLAIETHPNCIFDKLEVRDGLLPNSPLLGEYCSSQSPPPITTSSSEATINFHTDSSSTDTGFHISYSSVPGIPGCGGVLTGDGGSFSAPTLDGRYHHNLYCEWVIRVPPSETVELNVTAFHLEGGRSCRYDYLEIRDGGFADSALIGRYCDRNLPPSVTSSSNQLFIVFKSDSSVARSGFDARYQVACGGEFVNPTGIIRSPYHPQPYPHNRECVYVIRQPVGKAIVFNFTSFDVEDSRWSGRCLFDYVEVRDGSSSSFPLLGHFCGPPSSTPPLMVSTLNFLWIKFKTDSSVANRGFLANYTTIDIRCGGVLRDSFGAISSPNSPDRYPGNSDCTWVIEAPPGYVIQLAWQMFALESHENCQFDYVEIFDNSTTANGDQASSYSLRYCGMTSPPMMTSQDNIVTIHFHSDSSVSHDGFSMTYHTLNASLACGGHYHTEVGVIKSPRYPGRYPPSRTCEWTITAPLYRQIALNFAAFDVGQTGDCSDDYLEIRNGAFASSPLIARLCGVNVTMPEILSHTQHLYLKMVTNRFYSGTGFLANWSSATTGCGGTMTSVTGEIISPGYPQPYHHRADCYWDIRVNEGSMVNFHITDIDMETGPNCRYDFLEIRDPNAAQKLIGRYCSAQELVSHTASSNELKVRFRSDYSANGRGFKAQYFSDCRNELIGPHGIIESPNFPRPYPHDRNCSWTIRAPRGNSITVAFSHFDVEDPMHPASRACHYDYVELRVGSQEDSSRTVKGHYCGNRQPPPVSSGPGMDIMEVVFVSDESVAENGFRVEWQIVGCGGMYTKDSDEFTSPNYPNAYPANRDCEWKIQTSPGTRIRVTVHGFDIEAPTHTNECVFDSLKVYGGPDVTAPILTTLCHKSTDTISVTSDGNSALLVMNSDGSVRGNGFKVSYTSIPGGCGGLFTAPQGSIHSPNYPSHYDRNADCVWTITVDPLHVVELTFVDFDVEPHSNCSFDYVSVFDGTDLTSPILLQHCGSVVPTPAVWRSTGNSLTVRLKADPSVQSKGFLANYTTGCGAKIALSPGSTGELRSPNYPSVFLAGVNCTWHLEASEGELIQLAFNHLDIRIPQFAWTNDTCISDYVAVLDGAYLDSPQSGRYCGSSSPPAIYSSSRYLTVNMIIRMGHGVGFRATYSEVSSSCGGEFTSETGQFASPSFPDSYPAGYDCTWTVNAGAGNRVQLSFSQFDIASSENCNSDYVEVHERSAEGRLLLHNCSDVAPAMITANEGLWIRFRSGDASSAPGFLASYALLHGNDLYDNSGVIVSPLYPNTFHGVGEYSWRIQVTGSFIAITVEDLAVELDPSQDICLSSVMIYDGWNSYAYRLATLCGYEAPGAPIVTSGSSALIRFSSNSRFEGSKFRLRYTAVEERNESSVAVMNSASADPDCQFHIFVNQSTRVRSLNYPHNYNNSLTCEWVLEALPHSRLVLRIRYELEESQECAYDWIELYNGVDGYPNWNMTHRLCRRDQLPVRMASDGRFMRLRFITDSSVTRTGFLASVYPICGGILHEPDGAIYSPGFPQNNYRSNLNCVWTIKARPGRTIRLEFDIFRLVNTSATCAGDYLLIRNGESGTSPYLGNGRYCGLRIPEPLVSSANVLQLVFSSDSMNSDKGFHLRYYEVSDSCSGSHHLNSDTTEVTINTPNYPNLPHPHTECSWVITAPHDRTIRLDFQDHFDIAASFDGSCDQAWVEVRDGGTLLAPSLGKLCGSQLPSSVQSSDSVLFVRYFNNVTTPHSGFQAIAAIGTCGGTIRFESSGVITSPGFPEAYQPNVNCTWVLTAPVGHYIVFHFLQLAIHNPSSNCTADRGILQFRELNATGEVLDRVCGNTLPQPLETGSNVAVVTFQAGTNSLNLNGFSVMYNVSLEECGGDLSGVSGTFASPGYPHGYSHRRICVWRIEAPPGKRISLTFQELDLARQGRYCRDNILVYNGLDDHAPVLHRPRTVCRSQAGLSFNSSMNGMQVVFITRGHSTSKGFLARWTATEDEECGGEITGSSGSLSSPGLETGYYNHSLNCVWTYHSPAAGNTSLVLTVGHLHLERRCYDYILVEGVVGGERQVGQKICQDNENSVFVLPYPSVRISFITDYSVNFTGWNLTYSQASCGGYLQGPSDVIQSPGYPSAYPNNAHCAWYLNYAEGSQIELNFTAFRLEDSIHHDYVRVLNGRYLTSPELGRYSGSNSPGAVGPSMTNALQVLFLTDGSETAPGFRAVARQHDAGCGGILHGSSGNITSPGFPSNYPDNIECVWSINVNNGYQIRLSFLQLFDIETTPDCTNDYVQVFQPIPLTEQQSGGGGGMELWEGLPNRCGKQIPPSYLSAGTKLKLHFQTDNAVEGSGFKAQWQSVCGGTFNASRGYIMSPDHPGRYPRSANCTYVINAPPGTYVTITFLSFRLEGSMRRRSCRYDWLEVSYFGLNYGRTTQKLCGSTLPEVIDAHGPTTLSFVTDRSVEFSGFLLNYTVDGCGGSVTEASVITLPIRSGYHDNMDCQWNVTAPEGKAIRFKFTSLHLERDYNCHYDSVKLYEGFDQVVEKLIGTFCGNHTSELPIRATKGNTATVVFKTDASVTREGFSLAVDFVHSCGGVINISSSTNSQTIRSLDTNNDDQYEPLLHCMWLLIAPEDQVVALTFTRFDIEPQPDNDTRNCPYDYFEARDGASSGSELLYRGCGNSAPAAALVSSSNVLFVVFHSDSANQTSGFEATITSRSHPCGRSTLQASTSVQALQTPQYPQDYPVSTRCRWIITAPENQHVSLHFDDMDLEQSIGCIKDRVVIRNMDSNTAMETTFPQPGGAVQGRYTEFNGHRVRFYSSVLMEKTFCGRIVPNEMVTSSNQVSVSLISDDQTTGHGFRLHYAIAGCNRTHSRRFGVLSSDGVRNGHPCMSVIQAEVGSYVSVYFEFVSIREDGETSGSRCEGASLKVHDGDSTSSPLLETICGYSTPSPVFSTGRALTFHLTSNSNNTFYKAYYVTSTQPNGCGGSIVGTQAAVFSPSYPAQAAANLDCFFTFTVPAPFHVALRYVDIDFGGPGGCNSTYLEVYDVRPDDSNFFVGRYCGDERPAHHIAASNRVVVRYVTGAQVTGQGWHIRMTGAQLHPDSDLHYGPRSTTVMPSTTVE